MDILSQFGSSRFIKTGDIQSNICVYPIADVWWSRLFEYPWACQFAQEEDVCLDAACGIGHHLKFFLAKTCEKVYCCDIDPLLNNPEGIFNSIKNDFGIDAYNSVMESSSKMDFKCCNLTSLPYENEFFNKIYCISVLEHLDYDTFKNSFLEFYRTLKNDGFLVLTFDYPLVNLDSLKTIVSECNFKFTYGVDFEIPSDVLESTVYPGLKCFRALLSKNIIY